MVPEGQNYDVLQTEAIGEHHRDSHSCLPGTAEVGNVKVKVLTGAADMIDSATKVQDMARKAEKQTCAVESENPCMAETRSWSLCHSIARTPAPDIERILTRC